MAALLTNLHVYLQIAEDAAAESRRLLEEGRRPKPDGQPGYIVTWDPDRRSFKQSLIAIAFTGMYLEALLALVGKERLGKDQYKKIDRFTYEEKLKKLGVSDSSLLLDCKRFREARNDLVHEKALDLGELTPSTMRTAQEEASLGIELVKAIADALRRATQGRPR
jgi:hypothetical protein